MVKGIVKDRKGIVQGGDSMLKRWWMGRMKRKEDTHNVQQRCKMKSQSGKAHVVWGL
jgi:hypothetical protein